MAADTVMWGRAGVLPSRGTPPRPLRLQVLRETPPTRMTVQVVRDWSMLADHVPAWEELTAEALEANVFFEPWMLRPALETLRSEADVSVVLVYGPDPHRPGGPSKLCGLFPLERRRWRGLPVRIQSLWCHRHCYLGLPLLRADMAEAALTAFLDWLRDDAGGSALLEWPLLPGDGPFRDLLTELLQRRHLPAFTSDRHERALFRPSSPADRQRQLAQAGSGHPRLQRLRRRLEEAGQLEVTSPSSVTDAAAWAEQFLCLEASGWKGRAGTALACHSEDRKFFEAAIGEAFRRRRLLALALQFQGQPIALRCSFRAGSGAFAFKTCYDESLARYSPGALLELETLQDLGRTPGLRWMDSCTSATNDLLNRLWGQRRPIETVLMATGRWPGRLFVSLLPGLQHTRRSLANWTTILRTDTKTSEETSICPHK